ncbi:tyrosine-type recombinase/integrase [Caproiciproducens faecalis]|uniref:Site-specific integrase n=1 Tax=Caproiciproducens faecalis TaxID=2820301 RepID=A0ABS7DM90_9FIRM|nr:site-specific integrase [Caproiciproducens faecalis]MBW7572428.1 site-specific integrase [Caproiciproducens faecalis]
MASIRERNGAYFIMVSTGYDTTGKQIRKTMTWKPEDGMTEKQIEKALNEQAVLFEKKVLSGQVLDGSVTFAEFTERWCRDYAEVNLAPKTYARYQSMLKRILPAIGHIKLDKLQPHHLMELYKDMGSDINHRGLSFVATDDLMEVFEDTGYTREAISKLTDIHINTIYNVFKNKPVAEQTARKVCGVLGILFEEGFEPSRPINGLSNKTIKHHHRLISAILNQAVFWQVIPSNPASRVKPPKVARTEAQYLDEKQTAELLRLLEPESVPHQTMVKMFLYSGLRRGEMCGLEWKDIDFENHLITVRRSSQYVAGKGIYTKETKTETSDRTIKLPSQAFEVLKGYKVWQTEKRLKMGDRWEVSDRIFTQYDGKPIHPDSVTGWFRDFIAKTDLPQITIHSLRHTNITLLIAAGVPLRTVSYRAGHAQTSTTENIYAHAIKTADEMAADTLDDILTPKGNLKKLG